jgi:periplasmic protein CpxP/Spy
MSKEKFLTIAVVFLLMLNLGMIGYLFFMRAPHPPELWKLVVERVGFNDQQTEQYLLLRDEHRQGMNQLDDAFTLVLKDYLSLLKSPVDSANEASFSSKLAEIEQMKAQHTLLHFRKVRALCQPDQTERFDALIPDLMRVLLPPKKLMPPRRKP